MKTKAKILLIAHAPRAFTQFSSGLPLMKMLRDKGYYVAAGGTYGEMEVNKIENEGFDFIRFYIHNKINFLYDVKALLQLRKILVDHKFSLVNSQSAKAGVITRLASKLAKTPVVLQTVHAWPFHDYCPYPQKQFYKYVERFAAKFDDGIIVDSKEVKRKGLEAKICKEENIHQIYMGIDINIFKPFGVKKKKDTRKNFNCGANEYVIGCAARLVEGKGHDVLIKSFSQLVKLHPNSRCLIAGDGEFESYIRERIKEEDIDDKCIMLGRITNMPEFYNAIDVFCLPTHREGFGVALAEAMACGTPVVTTNIPPLDESVIDGVTGFLKVKDDVNGFASGLIELYNVSKRKKFSKACIVNIKKNFSSNTVNEKIILLYEKLLRQKGILY